MNKPPTIIITGSSGFIGSRLVDFFSERGFIVQAWQRRAGDYKNPMVSCVNFDLANIREADFQGADYLIHGAYQPVLGKNNKSAINIESARKIIAACRKHKVKIIFLSSLSAHGRAESNYGRQKFMMEALFDPALDLILKPGFVVGSGGGLFGRISSFLKNNKIIPLVGGGQRIQLIALDDLCRAIAAGIKKNLSGSFMVADPNPVLMKDFYSQIAKAARSRPIYFPVPLNLAYYILRIAEWLGLPSPITSENVLGLKKMEIFNTAPDLEKLEVVIKNSAIL